jgi:Na+/melibiose symporter-like transporter
MNYFALFFTKFRNPKERLLIATITELLSAIGTFIVIFLAPFYIDFGDVSSYRSLSINIAIFFIIPLLIGILGLREEEALINTYFSSNHAPKERFFKDFFQRFTIFKNRNFLILLFRWIVISIFNMLFFNTLIYYLRYVLELHNDFMVFLYILYTFWFIVAIIFSLLLSWFLGHLNIYKVSGFALGIALVFFFFADSILTVFLFMGIIGFIYGLETVSLIPLIGDIFDEQAVISRKRSEGFSYGFLTMFTTISIFIGPIVMSYVFSATGFNIYSSTQTPSAQMGIKSLLTMIPGISIIIMMIFFTIFYNLKPDKTEAIRMELRELEL